MLLVGIDSWRYDLVMDNLSGLTINSWTVVAYSHRTASGKHHWLCVCVCGRHVEVESHSLRTGKSKSCRPCSATIVGEKIRTHGMSKSKVYRAWQSMKTRCYNENAEKCYEYHGKLGVRVCDEWLNDFEAFHIHIGEPPTIYHTVDRIDSNGHYEPGNVRWATQHEQMQNRRKKFRKRVQKLIDI
jgi:hypothetical protein